MRILPWLALGALLCSGCSAKYHSSKPSTTVIVATEDRPGPPPHAPAHGYRHRHGDGLDLRYDSKLALYVVLGHSDCYYADGVYFRYASGSWEMSASWGGKWSIATDAKLPKSLHDKHKPAKGKGKHK